MFVLNVEDYIVLTRLWFREWMECIYIGTFGNAMLVEEIVVKYIYEHQMVVLCLKMHGLKNGVLNFI